MWDFLFHHTPLLYLTQSLWRDEAFSMILSSNSPLYFIPKIVFEPPLYYVMLHFWLQIFGSTEIAGRSLSLLGFVLANVVVIFWAEKLFKKHWLSWFLPVFFFFNPELLYYAFEIRAYGWYTFFAVASMFAYWEKRWILYILATTLGLYTHTFMVVVPAVQLLYHLIINRKDNFLRAFSVVALLASPWLIKVLVDLPKLKQSWYFPVDFQVIKSALGNLFIGYEGTPPGLWQFTTGLSLILIGITMAALWSHKNRIRNSFFAFMALVPVIVTLGISLYKPLFVNRYLIPATIAQIFLVVLAIELIKHKTLQKIAAALALLFVLGFNIWYPSQHAKKDIRNTVYEINGLISKNDIVLTDSPLTLFETLYYSSDNSRVFWYNPEGIEFPWYIGDLIFSPTHVIRELPPYPTRAFMIHTDATFDVMFNTPMSKIKYVGTNKK